MITPASQPCFIYKVASSQSFAAARPLGHYLGMPVDHTDGYIHFSSAAQLQETIRRHFAGQSGLVLIAVRAAELGNKLKWEPSRGGDLFPHFYGPLPLSAVAWVEPLQVGTDGSCILPEAVQ
jgi:uncharacterized protein (DUF952 family)